ncbi:type II toxin-antitoxin system VapC family toxin [Mitsuaria sp. GD03876]|uniref:type II toxin-antitoxin system VapC family toxin n=1 Tax=Mitsuaria sp. GD03876 TaxID=2975399 RepID=UPI00244AF848|nr:type II toxin-antitoxin system VapC family toxin [Mitsuaria sp. GD03876]MDH0866346.1 type II toxin-antitoxin system VapC family toxin [Mitsuaria sp. GD03876]
MKKRQVVDTSAWIEWMSDTALGLSLAQDFPEGDQCIVPTMVLLELAKWLRRESHDHHRDEILSIATGCAVHPLDMETAFLAARLGRAHGLTTADSAIYATARRNRAELITCDADFADLPGVRLYPKGSLAPAVRLGTDPQGRWVRWPTSGRLSARRVVA